MRKFADGVKSRGMKLNFITITIGFAGSLIATDPNLTTGYPIRKQLLRATGNELIPINSATIVNGGFENFNENTPDNWGFQDTAGSNTFIDTAIKHSGRASFRAEAKNNEDSRIFTTFDVKPFHHYTLRFWIKTKDLTASNVLALLRDENNKERNLTNLRMSLPKQNGGRSYFNSPNKLTTTGWEEVRIAFNSLNATKVNLGLTVFGGKNGTIWWDDISVIDTPSLNWLNRDDLPKSIKNTNRRKLTFGTDVRTPKDDKLGISGHTGAFDTHHQPPSIRITNTGNIKEGDIIEINGYHALPTANDQVSASWNHPEIYRRMRQVHQKL